MLITRRALGQGPMPLDVGALDAKDKDRDRDRDRDKGKGKGKGKAKDKPDAEVTCCHCSKAVHRMAGCWSRKEKGRERER